MLLSNQETATLFDTVPFYEEFLQVAQTPDGKEWAVVRPICNGVGVDFSGQRMKLSGDEQFNCGDISTVGADGKNYSMFCIPLEQVDLWLSGINLNRIKPENKEKLRRYRNECAVVMRSYFAAKKCGLVTPEMTATLNNIAASLQRQSTILEEMWRQDRYCLDLCLGESRLEFMNYVRTAQDRTGMTFEVILSMVKEAVGGDPLVDERKLTVATNFVKTLYGEGLRVVENPEIQE